MRVLTAQPKPCVIAKSRLRPDSGGTVYKQLATSAVRELRVDGRIAPAASGEFVVHTAD